MKRILVCIMVFGMANISMATTTGLFDLSIDGVTGLDEYELLPSDWVTIDLEFIGDKFSGGDIDILLSNDQGLLDWSGVVFETFPITRAFVYGSWYEQGANWDGAWQVVGGGPQAGTITGGNIANNTLGPYTLMDGLLFHCEEYSDVTISAVAANDLMSFERDEADGTWISDIVIAPQGTILSSITIHQVPEPMTMALLGLGGLGLIRRRRRRR